MNNTSLHATEPVPRAIDNSQYALYYARIVHVVEVSMEKSERLRQEVRDLLQSQFNDVTNLMGKLTEPASERLYVILREQGNHLLLALEKVREAGEETQLKACKTHH